MYVFCVDDLFKSIQRVSNSFVEICSNKISVIYGILGHNLNVIIIKSGVLETILDLNYYYQSVL